MRTDRSVGLAIAVSLLVHGAALFLVVLPGGGSGSSGGATRPGSFKLTRATVIARPPEAKPVPPAVPEPRNEAAIIEEKASPSPSPENSPTPEPSAAPVEAAIAPEGPPADEGDPGAAGTGNGSSEGFGLAAGKEYLSLNKVDVKPEYLRKAKLRYPETARRNGKEAAVIVEVELNENGRVDDCRVLSPPIGFGFEEAALDFVRNSRFSPARAKGKKVPVRMRLTIKFSLT